MRISAAPTPIGIPSPARTTRSPVSAIPGVSAVVPSTTAVTSPINSSTPTAIPAAGRNSPGATSRPTPYPMPAATPHANRRSKAYAVNRRSRSAAGNSVTGSAVGTAPGAGGDMVGALRDVGPAVRAGRPGS